MICPEDDTSAAAAIAAARAALGRKGFPAECNTSRTAMACGGEYLDLIDEHDGGD